MLLSELSPPFATKLFRRWICPPKLFACFDSTQQALKKYKGYDNEALIELVFQKTNNFIEEIKRESHRPLESHHLFLISAIALINKPSLKVLDFGGAFGTHYFIVKTFFPTLALDWTVVELPQVIKKGQQLKSEGGELKFLDIQGDFDTIIGDFDLVLTSGTLQHMPDPEKTLQFLCNHQAPYIALLRLGINLSSQDLWLIHKARWRDCGPGSLPAHFQDGIAAFSFCMMAEQNLQRSLGDYQLKLSNKDLSGTLSVPGLPIQGFNQLYQRLV